MSDEQIRILARPQFHPHKCDFEVDRTVLDGSAYFGDADSAKGAPLAEKLFALGGVESVLIRGNTVIVTKGEEQGWPDLAKAVGTAIREQLLSGEPAVADLPEAEGSTADESIRDRVQEVLDREINPAIAGHGGAIQILDVKNRVVYVQMVGGCQGCASSTATLKYGVETAVRNAVPEVVDILDTTDHAAGANPYYAPH